MTIRIFCLTILALTCVQTGTLHAQRVLQGKISNYNEGASSIESFDRFSGISKSWGEVNSDGTFTITLQDNFLNAIKAEAKAAQEDAPDGFTLNFLSVSDVFVCDSETVTATNAGALVLGLPELELLDEMGDSSNGVL